MADYGMRGEAAGRLMKKKGKGAPPEDDLGLPPEEGMDDAPPAEGAPPDLAALLGAGGGAPPPDDMPPDEGMPPEMPPGGEEIPPEEGQPQDLDSALGGVENALEGLPPEAGEEIRIHLNAIREIAAKAGATGGAMPGQEASAPEPVGTPPAPGSPSPEEPAL